MIRRLRCACVSTALVASLAVVARVAAKPPDLPENGTFTATPDATPPTPHENGDVICPYLRQRQIDRHACTWADPEMGRDVLENLGRLKRADALLQRAKTLARHGLIAEAQDCCVRAAELCPGSPCARRAIHALFSLTIRSDTLSLASEEASELLPEVLPEKEPTIDYEFEVGLTAACGLRMGADCSLGGNVYHLRYKSGCLTIWKSADASKTKP